MPLTDVQWVLVNTREGWVPLDTDSALGPVGSLGQWHCRFRSFELGV
jgi:hypothetical protein